MTYVVHAPWPYSHRSGGIRALYKLADELRSRGQRAVIYSLGGAAWGADTSPYDLDLAGDEGGDAIHVIPDICEDAEGGRNVVRWNLGPRRHPTLPGEIEFTWLAERDPDADRLMVDLIEPDLFYPKTTPGDGVLFWSGKGSGPAPPGATSITHGWPGDRSELADVLRAAGLLVSRDGYSCLNLEATVVGTPVLMKAEFTETALIGTLGVATDEGGIDQAYAEVGQAAAHYETCRQAMAADIDRFIDKTTDYFGTGA